MLPNNLTIPATLARLRNKEISLDALAGVFLNVIDTENPHINAFIEIIRDGFDLSASPDQALYGIPIAIKDLIDLQGYPTRAGSPRFFGRTPASKDAFVVERLKATGANIIGKTHTHEIALGITGINPHFGPVRNPQRLDYISGGSSSGSAAAVAAGMCLGALGSDTGGSIRIPAALCGVVGMKPTFGRVSTRGVLPLSWNLDHIGPIANTVEDAAILLQAIAGYDPLDPASSNVPVGDYLTGIDAGIRGWRVALVAGEYIEESDPAVLEAVLGASKVFAEMGGLLTRLELPDLQRAAKANAQMILADGAAFHRERLAEHPDWFGADVRQRLETGRALTSSEYSLARRAQSEIKRYFENFFADYDLLLLPTTPSVAVPIAGLESAEYAPRLTRFTAPFNLAGLPALSVPCGKVDGLPVGLQIVGPAWAEDRVLRAGRAFENVYNKPVRGINS
jgi:aspartyl-tRNA(Asn)/glutamyl-tRNA(Gln) amidotransferase subunit A